MDPATATQSDDVVVHIRICTAPQCSSPVEEHATVELFRIPRDVLNSWLPRPFKILQCYTYYFLGLNDRTSGILSHDEAGSRLVEVDAQNSPASMSGVYYLADPHAYDVIDPYIAAPWRPRVIRSTTAMGSSGSPLPPATSGPSSPVASLLTPTSGTSNSASSTSSGGSAAAMRSDCFMRDNGDIFDRTKMFWYINENGVMLQPVNEGLVTSLQLGFDTCHVISKARGTFVMVFLNGKRRGDGALVGNINTTNNALLLRPVMHRLYDRTVAFAILPDASDWPSMPSGHDEDGVSCVVVHHFYPDAQRLEIPANNRVGLLAHRVHPSLPASRSSVPPTWLLAFAAASRFAARFVLASTLELLQPSHPDRPRPGSPIGDPDAIESLLELAAGLHAPRTKQQSMGVSSDANGLQRRGATNDKLFQTYNELPLSITSSSREVPHAGSSGGIDIKRWLAGIVSTSDS